MIKLLHSVRVSEYFSVTRKRQCSRTQNLRLSAQKMADQNCVDRPSEFSVNFHEFLSRNKVNLDVIGAGLASVGTDRIASAPKHPKFAFRQPQSPPISQNFVSKNDLLTLRRFDLVNAIPLLHQYGP